MMSQRPEPFTLVVFGATGNLTRSKLVPAIYNLAVGRLLPEDFRLVGVARRPWNDGSFRATLHEALASHSRRPVETAVWDRLERQITYLAGDFRDEATYSALFEGIAGNVIFYLATPPEEYPTIARGLGRWRRRNSRGWVRLIVEKPFGHDLTSARELNRRLLESFPEEEIYRIDHYLGKETVQNILVFRCANSIFEPVWNRTYIDHVQITVAEEDGIGHRGGYYDKAGALRDIVQNHMLQLLCLVAMEPPAAFQPDAVRDEKVKVLRAIRPMSREDAFRYTVRGQYAGGLANGRPGVAAYREEPHVAPDSRTETYVALRLLVDNWRWAGVPFYLRTGKRLPTRVTEVAIQFRGTPLPLFGDPAVTGAEPNVLVLRIQPDEGIFLRFGAKVPGHDIRIRPVEMSFRYRSFFDGSLPEAYERLLLDCMLGDSTLFMRRDEVEAAWAVVTSILEGWASQPEAEPYPYAPGTWGPPQAEALLARDGRWWRQP